MYKTIYFISTVFLALLAMISPLSIEDSNSHSGYYDYGHKINSSQMISVDEYRMALKRHHP
jgi:hypothetical protein